MTTVLFAAPILSESASRMVEAVGSLPGVRLGVISQDAQEHAPAWARTRMAAHWRVRDVLDPDQLVWAATGLAERLGPPTRLFGAYEQLQVPLAEARARLGIDGMGVEASKNFRDKARMKQLLRDAGVPCARYRLLESEADAAAFAQEVGFPLVLKPPAGAGAVATYRADDARGLAEALAATQPRPGRAVLAEEFVVGDEHSLETISVDGRPVWHSLTHYYPTPLEVVRNPWIQWCILLPREVDEAHYDDIRRIGAQALQALGMTTGLTHLEWFRRKDGSVAVSEVAARPPGAQITTLVSRSTDTDFVQAWARLMVTGEFDPPARKYAAGIAFLRGQGQGRIRAIHGLDAIRESVGGLVVDAKLPTLGASPADSYEGDGWILVRHPQTIVVANALRRVISTVRVELG
jgi:formate-dependent phosphoribosylglycinamide formyltransferase (GAR transformylase)